MGNPHRPHPTRTQGPPLGAVLLTILLLRIAHLDPQGDLRVAHLPRHCAGGRPHRGIRKGARSRHCLVILRAEMFDLM